MTVPYLIPAATPRAARLAAFAAVRTLAFVCGFILLTAGSLRAQVPLDNFNNPGATGSVLPGTSWVNQITRDSTSITIGGTARDDNGWAASGQSINATGMTHVSVIAQRNAGHLAPFLVVQLLDTALRSHTVSISSSAFAQGTLTTVAIPLGTWQNGIDPSRITDWNIGGGTVPTGSVAFRMTFDHLSLTGAAAPTPPTITAEPIDRTIGIGTGTTMTVAATGAGTLRYQWTLAGTPIAGATGSTLSLSATTLAQDGFYQVQVSNDAGSTLSRLARLNVLDARPTHALAAGNTGYVSGGTVTISHTLTYGGTATSLRWNVLLPDGWSFVSSSGDSGATPPSIGTPSILNWTWSAVPVSPFTFTYTLNVPIGTLGDRPISSLVTFSQNGATGDILVRPDPLIVRNILSLHSADSNGDFAISLLELSRVIELYNTRNGTIRTGAYDVAATVSEDGFVAAPLRSTAPFALARYHAADSDRDGRISLLELSRVIELYNTRSGTVRTGRYHVVDGTEDGFAPGP